MKNILKFIIIFISYFFYSSFVYYFFDLINFKVNKQGIIIQNIVLILIDLVYLLFLLLTLRKDLIKDKKNFKLYYLSENIPIYIIGLFLMGLSNYIIMKVTNLGLSENEQSIRSLIKVYPVYMFYSSVINAPIVEEIIFRMSLKKIIKLDYIFILISGITFGLIHTFNSSINIDGVLLGIPYIIMGITFAYIYKKTDNIFTTIILHSFHNFILIMMQFLGG